ncbi:hypothetical protein GE061_007308 [Apolygus lucorum]|uniref:Pericentriolar material 1 protein C-terminal domain-containing protein n=1 Tax=Apolygus lucorum TaxID=248454 RepID=A0A6A4IWV6_APOLU|nr:hypothetical protein GE061_007308 [Apolygus lucorum]
MSGVRNTGTVPKTKHNARPRRENNPVNLVPNNLDWHQEYPTQRVRKESNNYASHLSDTGDDFMFESNPWNPLAPTNRTDDDELRWSNVKSSNITPERGNMDGHMGNRVMMTAHRQDNNNGEEAAANKDQLTRGRLKLKMEQSKRKIEELQQQQAALINLRNKAIQQVKPVQMEEMQNHPPPMLLRNKAVQQVKPVQVEMDKMANLGERIQTMQEYAHIIQAFEREDAAGNLEGAEAQSSSDQLRNKLSELLSKKAQCDNILSCLEADNLGDVAGSLSSEEGDSVQYSRYGGAISVTGGDGDSQHEGPRRRDQEMPQDQRFPDGKQNNREIVDQSTHMIHNKELKLEEVKNKLEQLQSLLNRVERLREGKSGPRMNGDGPVNPRHGEPIPAKNCPPVSVMEKLHTKKIDLEQDMRKAKSYPQPPRMEMMGGYEHSVENWANMVNGAVANSVDYSSVSDDAEVDYDESPVKLCSTTLLPPNSFPKTRQNIHHNISSSPMVGKPMSATGRVDPHRSAQSSAETHPRRATSDDGLPSPNSTTLALQINQLQMQMEQLLVMYQSLMEKQVTTNFNPPPPPPPQPWLAPQPSLGFMQYMNSGPQWHQHQLLVNSLNQCCQLIWHQQRELAGLRQALAMLQEESNMFKCGGYGNNLNFDSGLLWPHQTSPQTLNNQVPPGNRANNYWDNFRSYSRQNLLSGRSKSNEGSIAETLPPPRPPTSQTDNLRRKDNSATNAQRQPPHHFENASRLRRRFNTGNPKHDQSAVFSLEQSIYSELDTVIAEAERSPQMLLQLLSQLKNLRTHHPSPFEEVQTQGFEGELDLIERSGVLEFLPRAEEIRPPSNHTDYDIAKMDSTLIEVSRLVVRHQETTNEVLCSPEFLQHVVAVAIRGHHVHPDVVTKLEASLLKFQGTRLQDVADELLCVVANLLTQRPQSGTQHRVQPNHDDHEEEEGAVGGISLSALVSQQQPQSVETELAEADQTQHGSSDNVVVFETDEGLDANDLDLSLASPTREDRADHHQ